MAILIGWNRLYDGRRHKTWISARRHFHICFGWWTIFQGAAVGVCFCHHLQFTLINSECLRLLFPSFYFPFAASDRLVYQDKAGVTQVSCCSCKQWRGSWETDPRSEHKLELCTRLQQQTALSSYRETLTGRRSRSCVLRKGDKDERKGGKWGMQVVSNQMWLQQMQTGFNFSLFSTVHTPPSGSMLHRSSFHACTEQLREAHCTSTTWKRCFLIDPGDQICQTKVPSVIYAA